MTPTCSDCGAGISIASQGGRCRKCARAIRTPEQEQRRLDAVRAAMKRPEIHAIKVRCSRAIADARLSWCPRKYRGHYQLLRRKKGLGAKAAKAMILDQMRADTRGLDPLAAAIVHAGLRA